MLYSHNIPGSTSICPESATGVQPPEEGWLEPEEIARELAERKSRESLAPPPRATFVSECGVVVRTGREDTRSVSVRTLKGGLPG